MRVHIDRTLWKSFFLTVAFVIGFGVWRGQSGEAIYVQALIAVPLAAIIAIFDLYFICFRGTHDRQ